MFFSENPLSGYKLDEKPATIRHSELVSESLYLLQLTDAETSSV